MQALIIPEYIKHNDIKYFGIFERLSYPKEKRKWYRERLRTNNNKI